MERFPSLGWRYEAKRLIGAGGMAAVYLAHDRLQNREVAAKYAKRDPRNRIKQEFIRLFRLHHGSLVTAYEYHQADDGEFFTMEYCRGLPVNRAFGNVPDPVKPRRLLEIWGALTEALAYLHGRGIIHGDLKPENILLDSRGIKIIDLGLALRRQRDDGEEFRGTFAYGAPEVLSGEDDQSASSDIYSLGLILFDLVIGRLPSYDVRVSPQGNWNTAVREHLPAELAEILVSMLRYDPLDRPSPAARLLQALSETGKIKPSERIHGFKFSGRRQELSKLGSILAVPTPGAVSIAGPAGCGKSRLLAEANFLAQVTGRESHLACTMPQDVSLVNQMPRGAVLCLDDVSGRLRDDLRVARGDLCLIVTGKDMARFGAAADGGCRISLNPLDADAYPVFLKEMYPGMDEGTLGRLSLHLAERTGGNLHYTRHLLNHWLEQAYISRQRSAWRVDWMRLWDDAKRPAAIELELECEWRALSDAERGWLRQLAVARRSDGAADRDGAGSPDFWVGENRAMRCGLMEGFILERYMAEDRDGVFRQLRQWVAMSGGCSFDQWRAMSRLSLDREWAAVARERFDAACRSKDDESAIYFGQKLIAFSALAIDERLTLAGELVRLYVYQRRHQQAIAVLRSLPGQLRWDQFEQWASIYIYPIYGKDCDSIASAIAAGKILIQPDDDLTLNRVAIWDGLIIALQGDGERGKAAIQSALEAMGAAPGAKASRALGYYFLSEIASGQGNNQEVCANCFKALECIDSGAEPLMFLQSNRKIGGVYVKQGEYQKADEIYVKCIDALKNIVPEGTLIPVYISLACLYMRLCDNRRAMEYLVRAWQYTGDNTDETDRALILTNLAIIHAGSGQYHLALEMYREAARTLLELNNKAGYLQALCNMSSSENALGKDRKALRLLDKGLAIAREVSDESLEAMVLKNLGFFEYDHDEYRKSLDYLGQSVALYEKLGQEINRYIIETGVLDSIFLDDRSAAGYWESLMEKYPPITAFDHTGMKYIDGMKQIRDGSVNKGLRTAFEAGKEMKGNGDRSGAAFIWLRSGEMALRQDQPSVLPGIIQCLSQAAHEFEQLGEHKSLDKTRRLLARAEMALSKSPNVYLSYPMLSGLYELCSAIGTHDQPTAVAGKALNLVMELLGVERGGIFLKEPGGELVLAAQADLDSQTRRDAYEYSLHSLERAVDGDDLIYTNDTELDAAFKSRLSIQTNKIRSLLCAPIVFREGALGAIYLDSRLRTNLFDAAQRKFLKAMVDILGAVLEGSQLLRRMDEENKSLKKQASSALSGIIGEAPEMAALTGQVRTVAPVDISVLITGETGTGKELIARSIHELSLRHNKEFVAIDCGALPENLLEAELFGYAKGAFTDAKADKAGLFETAEGGTIFLDEVNSASKAVQARLLRVIETGKLRRVGETRERQVNVRLICATNSDLDGEIESGSFRKDLYYRIKEVGLHLPPLRERKRDILVLAEFFKRRFMAQFSRKRMRFSADAQRALLGYRWPGNVRELEHVVKSAVLLAPGSDILPADLELPGGPQPAAAGGKAMKEEREKQEITDALKATRGNVKRAAEFLGISRSQLYREMKKYKIAVD